jgi:WD40 repeat protein
VDDRPWIGELQAGKSGLRHDGAIRDIGFSPTEPRLLATASDDGNSRVWTLDLAQGRLEVGSDARLNLAHERPVTIARFVDRADDPNRLMTVSDRRVYFWSDANTHDERRHDDWVSEASVSKDGELLVSASQDGTARVWSSRTTVPVAVLRGHRNEVTHALFGPAGRIITSSRDRTLRAWRLNAPTLLAAGRPWQSSVALPSDGQGALLCGEQGPDGEVCAWSVLQGGLAQTGSAADGSSASARRHFGPAAAAGKPRPAGDKSPAAAPFLITTDAISLSSDGRMMLANRLTYDVYGEYSPTLWNLNASGGQITPDWLARGRYAVFNPARAELAVLGDKRDVAVWPQAALMQAGAGPAGNPLLSLAAQPDRYGISLSPDGRWLATLEGKRTMLWDRQAPAAPARELKGHKGDIRGLVFSADSSALVTASADRTARVWTVKGLAAGQMPPSVELAGGHSAALSSASFSPDGKRVVTASADNSVRVWDAASGRELAALYHHAGKVNDAVFDASGERIVSASDDGTAMVSRCDACRLPLADLVARARLIVRLTDDEEQRLRSEQQARSAFLTLPRWLGGGR